MSLERFNKTGLRDCYNVLKYLEESKDKPINERKGGQIMNEEKQPIHPEDEVVNESQAEPNAEATDNAEGQALGNDGVAGSEAPIEAPADDPDLKEPEDDEAE